VGGGGGGRGLDSRCSTEKHAKQATQSNFLQFQNVFISNTTKGIDDYPLCFFTSEKIFRFSTNHFFKKEQRMKKLIFCVAGIAAIAAVICTGCTDLGVNGDGDSGTGYTLTTAMTGGGSLSRYPDKTSYDAGEQVTVTATAASGYMFAGWSGASTSTSATVTITMDGNKTLTANFQQQTYTLTLNKNQAAGGSVSRAPDKESYTYGETVTITATAASGYTFTGWSGASTSTSASVIITMDGNKTLTANFQGTYSLTVSSSPAAGGNVSRNPNKTAYTAGETVTLTATPNANYTLAGWIGASPSTGNTATVVMNANKTVTAVFEQTANAVIITLTSLSTTVTDVGGIDPRVHFVVTAYRNRSEISSNTTGYLLNATDISQPWSGSVQSSAVPFANQADSLVIRAVVVEKDLLFDDDISPGYYTYWKPIPAAGVSGSTTLDYGSGKSRVGFSYRFVLQ
jgi:uncharacterized repeat protein (TIGR02543 family)